MKKKVIQTQPVMKFRDYNVNFVKILTAKDREILDIHIMNMMEQYDIIDVQYSTTPITFFGCTVGIKWSALLLVGKERPQKKDPRWHA